jgi:site-specific recombinase XerD
VPQPYGRTQLRALQATLGERWPKLPREEAEKWLTRYKEGRSPYSRVRVHAISTQLDAIIALALHLGLKRSEIFRLSVDDAHFENAAVLVRHRSGDTSLARETPWTSRAHFALERWIKCRSYLGAEHDRLWLNLHTSPTANSPMTVHTFNRVLSTYVGPEWNFARLRVTSAVLWTRCGLPLERLRELLGLARIEDVLPYTQLAVTETLERDIDRLNGDFIRSAQEVPLAA